MSAINKQERHIMAHTTAWDSKSPLFRNHFCTGEGGDDWPIIQGLVERGLMRVSRQPSELSGGGTVFAVTQAGIRQLESK